MGNFASPNSEDLKDDKETNVLAELYHALDSQPTGVEIHEMLVGAWESIGELDMAYGAADVLLQLDPRNNVASEYLRHTKFSRSRDERMSACEVLHMEKRLEKGYRSLRLDAEILSVELSSPFIRDASDNQAKALSVLDSISSGKVSSAVSVSQPVSVREAARGVLANFEQATELILEDFEEVVQWMTNQIGKLDTEKIRQRLAKRRTHLEAALPESMQKNIATAFQLTERDHLQRKYENTETIYGDKIEDIPPANFFVSEDNYAFDMEELAQGIAIQDGVMRNLLSRQMFSQSDIQTILAHPLGERLKPLEEAQQRLKKGVRTATIARIEELGKIMLADHSMDGGKSQEGVEEFLAFVATLPSAEQDTVRQLKVPAADNHTGQPFDYSIAESIDDARAGTTCYHKVGDFLSQAADFLRQQ
ncbi:hypothetical protein P152DRAFT_444189 [Eremomyces bilateralis CBS 781.70]|uniref:Uncharacterized protein n=1 Tax=Eremomyces bilateralis CBS 781.70 TaxID=1392243 RepID=A0A6G1FRG2_9PEZI|nr:uncharacterized protein P152DRAFT_444189 [Eremomyces bilateralis CBS 781.70]KAF1808252.1 hypothetical protein P152DRAFT_444189 [Eremomyces bilateralis CBS 781.70]